MASGSIVFPGIAKPRYMIAWRQLGARPSRALIYAQPQPGSPDTTGTATLSFGFNGVTVNWTNALCDKGSIQLSKHGHVQYCEILDRRWRWLKAYWTRAYNVRNPDGTIDQDTVKSLAQIATDLFTAMGDPSADVSAITSTELPEVTYDHDNCADAIEDLLDDRGYVISLLSDNTVKVFVRGTGTVLPANDDVINASLSINPPEFPQTLTAVGKRTMVQSKLLMLPVGIDLDGQIKPVDELSYMPPGGWDGTDMVDFNMIVDTVAKELCLLSVGRWYQVVSQADGSQHINFGSTNYSPGELAIADASQLLPLSDKLLTSTVDQFGKVRYDLSFIEGTFYDGDPQANPPRGTNVGPYSRVDRREFTLTGELGIVEFKELAIKQQARGNTFTFADVYLTCSYSVEDPNTFVKDRYVLSTTLGGIGEDQRTIELRRQIILEYATASSTVNGVDDNKSALNQEASRFLASVANEYVNKNSNVIGYRGIYPFDTDGVNLQLIWNCAVRSAVAPWSTMVSQYAEGFPQLPTRAERALQRRVGRGRIDR